MAILKVEGRSAALPVVSSRGVNLGTEVFTLGYPNIRIQGVSCKLTKGEISSLAGLRDDPRHLLMPMHEIRKLDLAPLE